MSENREIDKFMYEQFGRFSPVLDEYQWPWEIARWHELAFCFIVSLDKHPGANDIARETVDMFVNLDLLEIEILSQHFDAKGKPDVSNPDTTLMISIMRRQGYSDEQAKAAVVALIKAAQTLQSRFGGKVQKYFREYGKRMVSEFSELFSINHINKVDVKYAVTLWIQNTVNMPVCLSNPSVEALCERFNASVDDLIEAADINDINVALIDDWATDYITVESEQHHE